jgi:predicted KAP-like P-loop ATPase
MDHVEKDIPEANVPTVIQALFDVGDALIDPDDERGMFDFGDVSRAARLVYHLLKRLPSDRRAVVLQSAIESGRAVAVQSWLLQVLDDEATKAKDYNEAALTSADEVTKLKQAWLDRVRVFAGEPGFLDHPELPRLLAFWKRWGDGTEVRVWCEQVTSSDEGLLSLLPKFLQHTRSQTVGDWAVRLRPRLDPRWLGDYIDTEAAAERLRRLQQDGQVPDAAREAVSQYLKEHEMLEAGKDPDGFTTFDD